MTLANSYPLSTFQILCAAEVVQIFRGRPNFSGIALLVGVQENYLIAKVLQFSLWIYKDGAMIEGPSGDYRFEIQDHQSIDTLRAAFIDKCKTIVAGVL